MAARGRKSGLILIILALVLIVGAVALFFILQPGMLGSTAGQPPEDPAAQQPLVEMTDIVVTTQKIPRGAALTAEVLTTVAYPRDQMVAGLFYNSIEQVVGQRAVEDIPAQVPLTTSMIMDQALALASYPSFEIPENYTALSIPVSKLTSVSYGVRPGDHVMVIGCALFADLDQEFQTRLPNTVVDVLPSGLRGENTSYPTAMIEGASASILGRAEIDETLGEPVYVVGSEPQRPRLACFNVVPDATVLKLGDFEVEAPEPVTTTGDPALDAAAQMQDPAMQQPPAIPTTISLIVSPQDAINLNYLMLAGAKLNLALRNPTDPTPITTDMVTLQYLMEQKGLQLPARLPYGLEPRVDVLRFPGESGSDVE